MKVLLDTNIVLDVLLQREPFCKEAKEIFAQVESGKIEGFLCATTITTIYYLVSKTTTISNANDIIKKLLLLFEIATVNKHVLQKALQNSGKDFEDSVIYTSAEVFDIDVIISRDLKGFKKSKVMTQSPKEFLLLHH
jgi:predicted nucleic acid-binding protein